jgi:hypothetical protein
MNNTRYAEGGPYTVRDAQLIILSGYEMGNGTGNGLGCGVRLLLSWHNAGTLYVTHAEIKAYRNNRQKIMIANLNGAGGSGFNAGCGVCHNNNGATTDNNANSWCCKIIPMEVEMEKIHS